jgi:ketosteroid isomerase-like protein
MNTSVELKSLTLRLYESMTSGDLNAIVSLFSHQSGVLAIGSDPNEWWAGYDTIERVFKVQFQQTGKVQVKAGELHAFAEGTVGWVASRPTMRLPNGQEIQFRETMVFHKEDGEWRIVHFHDSLGVPNVEAIGKELTTQ